MNTLEQLYQAEKLQQNQDLFTKELQATHPEVKEAYSNYLQAVDLLLQSVELDQQTEDASEADRVKAALTEVIKTQVTIFQVEDEAAKKDGQAANFQDPARQDVIDTWKTALIELEGKQPTQNNLDAVVSQIIHDLRLGAWQEYKLQERHVAVPLRVRLHDAWEGRKTTQRFRNRLSDVFTGLAGYGSKATDIRTLHEQSQPAYQAFRKKTSRIDSFERKYPSYKSDWFQNASTDSRLLP